MWRAICLFLLSAVLLSAANFKLYLADGNFHLVREYRVEGDRVRYYSIERSDWEEIPLSLVDLKRTESERKERDETLRKDAAEMAAEEKFEREQREERERVPQNPGAYFIDGKELRTIKAAEVKVVTNKKRSVLKVIAPIPVVAGKSTVEIEGEQSANTINTARPEFYLRLAQEERFFLVRLKPKKNARLVQTWMLAPTTKDMFEEEEVVETFRRQVDDLLYRIWPTAPLEPGEYALVEYTLGKGNIQVWDFSYRK